MSPLLCWANGDFRNVLLMEEAYPRRFGRTFEKWRAVLFIILISGGRHKRVYVVNLKIAKYIHMQRLHSFLIFISALLYSPGLILRSHMLTSPSTRLLLLITKWDDGKLK